MSRDKNCCSGHCSYLWQW
ncbi:hypothetical protein EPA93_41030 [Ktedonosporobacter rubrisoli]|uniref:Uncharacterized protein n=1 Tax=Ktedonosporobacter rubrisoli TaxID=2509675 RepID=A0A4P6K5U0_KTERU|nr:hypothetical protein EPA93_41030 [Ktedonosporobacter rubrisoli]